MDNLINFGKQAYSAYEQSQQGNNQQQGGYGGQQGYQQGGQQGGYGGQQNFGGQGYDQPGQFGVGGGAHLNQPSGGYNNQGIDLDQAAQHAQNNAGDQDSSLFSSALGALKNTQQSGNTHLDEDAVQNAHDQAYNQNNAGNMDAGAMGSAAAMQALKRFTGSGSAGGNPSGSPFQSQLIGMAMSEAAKLFDQSGGAAQGSKQDAVQSAGQTIMKLLMKNQVSGMMGGGNSGGLSSLLGKFM